MLIHEGEIMKLRITIDVFSGRPNPILYLEGHEAEDAAARLRPEHHLERTDAKLQTFPTLGYRGLRVDFVQGKPRAFPKSFRVINGNLLAPGLWRRVADPFFEDFVCSSMGPIRHLPIGQKLAGVLDVVGRYADQKTWDKLHELGLKTQSLEEKGNFYNAMAVALSPELRKAHPAPVAYQ
jgi:hypothetical protein